MNKTNSHQTPETLLRDILERFPQADPASGFYDEPIDGCEAVNFLSGIVPKIRMLFDQQCLQENATLHALKAAWNFIEDVADDDPERSEKFFALRGQVRQVFWNQGSQPTPILAIVLDGGLVQAVVTDHLHGFPSSLKLLIVDYDIEGVSDDELTPVPQDDGSTCKAVCRIEALQATTVDLRHVLEQLVGNDTT